MKKKTLSLTLCLAIIIQAVIFAIPVSALSPIEQYTVNWNLDGEAEYPTLFGSWPEMDAAVTMTYEYGASEDGEEKALVLTTKENTYGTGQIACSGEFGSSIITHEDGFVTDGFAGASGFTLHYKSYQPHEFYVYQFLYYSPDENFRHTKGFTIPATNGEWSDLYIPLSALEQDTNGDWIYDLKATYPETLPLFRFETGPAGGTLVIDNIEAVWDPSAPPIGGKILTSISVEDVKTEYLLNEQFDAKGNLVLTYSDGSVVIIPMNSEGVSLNSVFDTTVVSESREMIVEYGGHTCSYYYSVDKLQPHEHILMADMNDSSGRPFGTAGITNSPSRPLYVADAAMDGKSQAIVIHKNGSTINWDAHAVLYLDTKPFGGGKVTYPDNCVTDGFIGAKDVLIRYKSYYPTSIEFVKNDCPTPGHPTAKYSKTLTLPSTNGEWTTLELPLSDFMNTEADTWLFNMKLQVESNKITKYFMYMMTSAPNADKATVIDQLGFRFGEQVPPVKNELTSIAVKNVKTKYLVEEQFDENGQLVLTYSNGTSKEIPLNSKGVNFLTPFDTTKEAKALEMIVEYEGLKCSYFYSVTKQIEVLHGTHILSTDMNIATQRPDSWGAYNGGVLQYYSNTASDGKSPALLLYKNSPSSVGAGGIIAFVNNFGGKVNKFEDGCIADGFIGADKVAIRYKSHHPLPLFFRSEHRATTPTVTKASKKITLPSTNGEWTTVTIPLKDFMKDENDEWIFNMKFKYTTNFDPVITLQMSINAPDISQATFIDKISFIWDDHNNIEPEKYSVSFDSQNGQAITKQELEKGSLLTKYTPVYKGYSFLGWYKNRDLTIPWNFEVDRVYNDITLYAKWEKSEEKVPTLIVNSLLSKSGKEIEVNVSVKNNPGIASLLVKLSYDKSKLVPKTIIKRDEFLGTGDFTSNLNSNEKHEDLDFVSAMWVDTANMTSDGELFTVKFKLSDNLENGKIPVTLTYEAGNIVDEKMQDVEFAVENGEITIENYISGDIYSDGIVNVKDILKLTQYLAGMNVQMTDTELAAANVYLDDKVNTKDAMRLSQFLAGYTGIILGE